jgi:hypothetical protein
MMRKMRIQWREGAVCKRRKSLEEEEEYAA